MNKTEFDKQLKTLVVTKGLNKGSVCPDKIKAMPSADRAALVRFIVRNRGPVLESFMSEGVDKSWLHSCGYLHVTRSPSTGLVFHHTAEHQIH